MPFAPMVHTVDPKDAIYKKIGMKKLGILDGYKLYGNRVLLAIYERPEKTKSGIILSDQTRNEDQHQGKSGLAIMFGPTAFVDDNYISFPTKPELGDWVSIHVSDGRKMIINGQLCRLVKDQDVALRIPFPDVIF